MPSLRPGDAIFEVAEGSRTKIAWPEVSPGPAGFLAFAGRLAALAGRVRRQLEMPIVAATAIDGELDRSGIQLDDAGAAHTRHAAGCGHTWRDPRLEPAYGIGVLGRRIGKRPGAAARITLAARRALRGIAGARGRAGVVSTWAVVADLRTSGPTHTEQSKPAKQPKRLNFHAVTRTASRQRQHATAGEKTTSVAGEPGRGLCRLPRAGARIRAGFDSGPV